MKIFKITILVIVLAMLGSTFTVDAKAKKRRITTKKEKTMQKKDKTAQKKTINVNTCGLDMVEYEHSGMRLEVVSKVRVERKNGKVTLITQGSRSDEKEFVIDDGEQLLREALTIIEQEKMLDYGVSYELPPNMQPLDGYMWSFSAKLSDGRSVSSRGHNAGPEGEGLGKIHILLFKRAYKLLGVEFF